MRLMLVNPGDDLRAACPPGEQYGEPLVVQVEHAADVERHLPDNEPTVLIWDARPGPRPTPSQFAARRLSCLVVHGPEEVASGSDPAGQLTSISADALHGDLLRLLLGQMMRAESEAFARQRVEQLLGGSEQHFRQLFEEAPLAYQSLDEGGRLLDVNPAWLALLGYERPKDVLGRAFREFVDEDDLETSGRQFPAFHELGEVHGVELRLRRCDGTTFAASIDGRVARDARGSFLRTHCLLQDVTDLKSRTQRLEAARREAEEQVRERTAVLRAAVSGLREEVARRAIAEQALSEETERLQMIVETLPHGILETDTVGTIVFANAAFHRIHGCPEGSLLGESVWSLHQPGPALERAKEYVEHVLRERPPPTSQSFRTADRDGRSLDLRIDWNYRSMADGGVGGFVAVVTDITRERRAEEQARRRLDELAQVARLATMGEMVSGLAHELNQPLATIANYAYACRHYAREYVASDAEALRDALHQIAEQAGRAGAVIRRLRAYARKADVSHRPVDINGLVRDVVSLMEIEARLRGIQLQTDLTEGLPEVTLDRLQIEQALTNLVRNALEATIDCDGPQRNVVITTRLGDGGMVQIVIADEGVGLQAEVVTRMYEPFFTTKPKSLGLGLSIARSIIEAHNGVLRGGPRDELGAEFTVALPVCAVATEENALAAQG
ncbi:MAG: PAS domain-containing sensor histidine kinase [Planctomycetota bacterium]